MFDINISRIRNNRRLNYEKGSICMVECCLNCKYCIAEQKNNRYNDVEYFCLSTGYFIHKVKKDRNKIKRFTPGGKELVCNYEKIMRDATKEEQDSVNNYINNISEDTGINFYDILN